MTFVLVEITLPNKTEKKETKQEREFIMGFVLYDCKGLEVS